MVAFIPQIDQFSLRPLKLQLKLQLPRGQNMMAHQVPCMLWRIGVMWADYLQSFKMCMICVCTYVCLYVYI